MGRSYRILEMAVSWDAIAGAVNSYAPYRLLPIAINSRLRARSRNDCEDSLWQWTRCIAAFAFIERTTDLSRHRGDKG